MTAREIMTQDVQCCTPDTPIRDAANMMIKCDCGIIPVVESMEDKKLVGVITDRDICCRAVANGMDPNSTLVANCMSADVMCCTPNHSVDECENLMEVHQVRRIPIVAEDNTVVGIVAQADVARARPHEEVSEVVKAVSQAYAG